MLFKFIKPLFCRCIHTDLGGFPLWSIMLGFVSHVLLTVNSSTNLLIYCWVVPACRDKMVRMLRCASQSSPVCRCGQVSTGSY